MLVIRLQRIGKKGQPSYRMVVAERRSKMKAPPVEDLGAYRVGTKSGTFNKERVLYWVKMGAQPTVTAHNLLVTHGVLSGPKMRLHIKVKPNEGGKEAAAPVEAAPAEKE